LMTEETYNLLREVSHPGLYTEMYWHLYLWVKQCEFSGKPVDIIWKRSKDMER
jgi:hypothetical protein